MSGRNLKINKQVVFATLVNCLECYDVTLYSFFATLMAPVFFPSDTPGVSLLASFAAFALGMAVRPIGGILFGHVGDKYGRKSALKTSLFFIVVPTLIIGLLPSYQTIGFFAPMVLIICLLLQGLCVGGEYSGASVFVVEHSKNNYPGFWGAVLISSGFLGSLIGTIMGYVFTKYMDPEIGWRLPFIIGGVMGLLGLKKSNHLQETPDFEEASKDTNNNNVKSPFLYVLKEYPINFICLICIGGASFVPVYVSTTYLGSILSNKLNVAHSMIMLFYASSTVIYLLFLPIMGFISDKIGAKKTMTIGTAGVLLSAYPLFNMLSFNSVASVVLVQVVLSLFNTVFSGPSLLFQSSLFPTTGRQSALGVGYNLGGALFGGTAPLVCAYLVGVGNNYAYAGLYVAFVGFLGLLGVVLAKKIDHSFDDTSVEPDFYNQDIVTKDSSVVALSLAEKFAGDIDISDSLATHKSPVISVEDLAKGDICVFDSHEDPRKEPFLNAK